MSDKVKVQFHFRLNAAPNVGAVEKAEGGAKKRYLEGVTSGSKVDGHGERMTEACILSFQRQAESGDILLYGGLHGVNFIDDIGKLVESTIDPDGNWKTKYRLYDESDGMDSVTLGRADKLWKQVCGLAPYTKPRQKGFSIEGEVPPGGILSAEQDGRRVMNDVTLTGVVVVDKPAYADSIAHGVYKALGLTPPWRIRKALEKSVRPAEEGQDQKSHFRTWYQLQDALDDGIRTIMTEDESERPSRLADLLGQFSTLAQKEILDHPDSYSPTPRGPGEDADNSPSPGLLKLQSLADRLRSLAGTWREGVNRVEKHAGIQRQP
jgi:hypothetical protein